MERETEVYLRLPEVMRMLGISERTARRWIKAGRLKASRPGRDFRIAKSDVEALMEETVVPVPLVTPPLPFGGESEEVSGRADLLLEVLAAMRETYAPGEGPHWSAETLRHVRGLITMAAVRVGADEAEAGRPERAAQIVARAHEVGQLLRLRLERVEAEGPGDVEEPPEEMARALDELAGEAA